MKIPQSCANLLRYGPTQNHPLEFPTLTDIISRFTWLTHWGRVTHICIGKLTIIGSDNGLLPGRRLLHHVIHHVKQVAVNTWRPRQNGRHFADNIFKSIFLTENVWISINNSLKFVPKVQINNIPALVGAKPLSEPMMLSLLMHICVTRPQWVNGHLFCDICGHNYFVICTQQSSEM